MSGHLPWAAGLLVAAVALVSACGGSAKPVATPTVVATPMVTPTAIHLDHSGPAIPVWEPTGEYRTELSGIGLTVYSYSIKWDHIAVLYSLDKPAADAVVLPHVVRLSDDLGETYKITSHAVLGSALGVTAGLLVAEPYKGQGRTLTLTVYGLTPSTGGEVSPLKWIPGDWSVTFIENTQPGTPVAYHQSGRIGPEVISAGDLTIAVAGGGKLVIDRAGEQSALYGHITYDGVAEALTKDEIRVDYPPPPGFPTPEADP